MAYDTKLAERILKQLVGQKGLTERKMFGGIGFMLNGNLCAGVHADEMIVRCAIEDTDKLLTKPHAKIFDLAGKPMRGWLLVDPKGLKTEAALGNWVEVGVKFAGALPPKKK